MHLLLNADLYAPEHVGLRHLLVAGERIAWVGEDAPDLPVSLGATRQDLEGRRVVPGLIDGHVHVTGGGGEGGFASRVPPLPIHRITRGGTTTVIGLLGTDDALHTTADLVARTRALRAEGLSAWCLTGGYHLPPTTLTGSVRDDILHVDPILGVGEVAISDLRSSQPTFDELLRLASEAHLAGMLSGKAGVLHLHVGRGARGLDLVRRALAESELPARTFHPTHVNRTPDLHEEALALVRDGLTVDFSASASAAVDVRRYLDSDLPSERLTVSSDGGGSMPVFDDQGQIVRTGVGDPGDLAIVLTDLVASGIPLEDALPPFTSNVARHWKLERKGSLGAGMDADLVVLDGGSRPRDVMARGCWHVRAGEVVVRGTFEDA